MTRPKNTTENKKAVTVTLSAALLRRIDRIATSKGWNRSQVIEYASNEGLKELEEALDALTNPALKAAVEMILSSPEMLQAGASLAGEKMSIKEAAAMADLGRASLSKIFSLSKEATTNKKPLPKPKVKRP